jgi:multicomponent Na+:H+ antiporter subunit G
MDQILDILTWLTFAGGAFFLVAGGIGLIRFPDFYTRMHAAGMTDTMGAGLVLLGMVLQSGDVLTSVKLVLIGFFIFFTSPTSTYEIENDAFSQGLKPIIADDPDEGDNSSKI